MGLEKSEQDANFGSHAIIVGNGIAGVLNVRVLAEYFTSVTVVERDKLPVSNIAAYLLKRAVEEAEKKALNGQKKPLTP